MRAGSRFLAALMAAAVWIYAAMTLAPQATTQATVPPVLEAAAIAAVCAVD
jgi:hypothetical protein